MTQYRPTPPLRFFIATGKFLCACHLCFTHFYSWGAVAGPSMLPDWEIWGQGAVVSHLYRHGRGVQVGDLVKFKVPISEADAIKRVAGLPGDYVLVHTPGTNHEQMIQVSECVFVRMCQTLFFWGGGERMRKGEKEKEKKRGRRNRTWAFEFQELTLVDC